MAAAGVPSCAVLVEVDDINWIHAQWITTCSYDVASLKPGSFLANGAAAAAP